MSWKKSTTTKHTCGGPVFGKKTPGCPRCDELLAGSAPVRWEWAERDKADRKAGRGKYASYVPCKHEDHPAWMCTANQW